MKPLKALSVLWFLHIATCYAQPASTPELMIGAGASAGFFNQLHVKGLQGGAFGINAGFIVNRYLFGRCSLWTGLTYNYKWAGDYRNEVIFQSGWVGGTEAVPVHLSTSLKQHYFEVPVIFKYRVSKFTAGAGISLSYLLLSRFSQDALGNYAVSKYPAADASFTEQVHFVYHVDDYAYTSAFSKVNVSPLLNIGYRVSSRLAVEYICSYDLVSNPRLQFKFNAYNLLNNQLLFTFKVN